MPLTAKGEEILASMEETYNSKKKAKEVFYASVNAGKITGVDSNISEIEEKKKAPDLKTTHVTLEGSKDKKIKDKDKKIVQRDPMGREKATYSKTTQRDPMGREKSTYKEPDDREWQIAGPLSDGFVFNTDEWSEEARKAAIEARKNHATGGMDKPASPHSAGPAGTYEHAGTANLAAQGFKPKKRAENTQHGAALTAWSHAKNIGKPATAALGGRGWTIVRPGDKIPIGTPHMMVHPEGVVHAYKFQLKKDSMPVFQMVDSAPRTTRVLHDVEIFDSVEFDDASGVNYTKDGYLVAQPRVARTGIQLYKGSECGKPDMDVVRVYRPADSVFAPDAMRSFAHKPITIEHPDKPITADNWKKHAVGQVGDEVTRDGNTIRVPMVLMDKAAIEDYKAGRNQLSVGYTCDLEWTAGITQDSEPYDAYQKNIRANHLAVVANARGGSSLRIGDSKEQIMLYFSPIILRTDAWSEEARKAAVEARQAHKFVGTAKKAGADNPEHKSYTVYASSRKSAAGKALKKLKTDFPEHHSHYVEYKE